MALIFQKKTENSNSDFKKLCIERINKLAKKGGFIFYRHTFLKGITAFPFLKEIKTNVSSKYFEGLSRDTYHISVDNFILEIEETEGVIKCKGDVSPKTLSNSLWKRLFFAVDFVYLSASKEILERYKKNKKNLDDISFMFFESSAFWGFNSDFLKKILKEEYVILDEKDTLKIQKGDAYVEIPLFNKENILSYWKLVGEYLLENRTGSKPLDLLEKIRNYPYNFGAYFKTEKRITLSSKKSEKILDELIYVLSFLVIINSKNFSLDRKGFEEFKSS